MLEKLEITKENGEVLSVDIISAFKISVDNGEKIYCLTTANELDQNGLVKILASEVTGDRLVKITDDKEWMNVKNVMRSIISSSPDSYTYVNVAKHFNATVDFARVIAVQDSAKMQLINDYNAKKPVEEEHVAPAAPVVDESVAPAIYPKENPSVAIGSEIVPGISIDNSSVSSVNDIPINNQGIALNAAADSPVVPTPDVTAPTDESASHQINDEPAFSFPTPGDVVNNLADDVEPVVTEKSTTVDVPTFEDASVVQPAVEAPSPVVPEASADVNIDNDNAKQVLVDKIMAAVNEYIASMPKSVDTKDKDEKIASLEQELTEKNKKLDEILSLLGKN
jgi:hypothetical protein